ncbi:hypothetical protein [Nocardia iowensis]|uniref:Secreted protein n=1 Tax=Nocardia iowensis TaxID=204891 RepID=A0ABX8RZN6_NOCIO|nr:hypothetical protein [Nocardia iowensis]QXN94309.1 hypothetical protein KV110_15360 [Nocardia iowensis]
MRPDKTTATAVTATAVICTAVLLNAAPAAAETHTEMPTLYTLATEAGGLCAGTINAKINTFADSDQVSVGYQANFGGVGGCATTVVFTWHNVDTGTSGAVTNQVVSWSYSASFRPGPGRIAIEMATTTPHFPQQARVEVYL